MSSYPVLVYDEEFQKEYQSLKPPYQTDVILGKVQEVMPTLLSISKCKGHVERFCRLASDSAADPDRGLALKKYASVFSLISLLGEKEEDLISNKERIDGAPYIRTKRPGVQLPEEDSISIRIEGVDVVQTNEFMRALELYFTAAFVQPVVLEQNM